MGSLGIPQRTEQRFREAVRVSGAEMSVKQVE